MSRDQSGDETTQTLAVIGCGNAKRDEASPARDLYTSNYFALKLEYADHFADRVVILSAEHGLVWSKRTIDPYDTTLDDRDREALVDDVTWSLRSPFTDHSHTDEVLLLAGRDYARVYFDAIDCEDEIAFDPLGPQLDVVDVFAEADLGGIGEQMGWIRRAVDKDLRQPDGGETEQQTGLTRFSGRTKPAATDGGRRD
ncbi:DUF6884 domain-containing protein [Halorubrum tebenquichense]|uniref:DUF6884 domain-containing protein n=1 Tax=Halorubrum tebenquichense DSM 14210 TaxID=1227485 RepID=M0E261_9EURY|nr:DUF6884 domain-containing protein [Halorubrum tebenquichense]ELZ41876.1 hypothetical protein C472_00494 [Halorubrum tebenquichense DSM 14210]